MPRKRGIDDVLPPTAPRLEAFRAALEEGDSLVSAVHELKYTFPQMREALRRGRQREPGFDLLVDIYEEVTADQSKLVWRRILQRVKEGDFAAIKMFYQARLHGREAEIQKALASDEWKPIDPEAPASQSRQGNLDLDAIEARATAALRAAAGATEDSEGVH